MRAMAPAKTSPRTRPYECVRRAWHSDRHRPLRRSVLLHLFRMAHEMHSPVTRKNREWQEKLPAVALKAEEILYSKAPSESHYSDVSTLWARANEAIDTIIRNDVQPNDSDDDDDDNSDGAGNPDLLLPCIEAALVLGCMPRRASRSQRYANPASFLSSPVNDRIASQYSTLLKLADANDKEIDMDMEMGDHLTGSGRTHPLYWFQNNGRGGQDDMAAASASCDGNANVDFGRSFVGSRLVAESSSNNVPNSAETTAVDGGCDLSLRLGMPLPSFLGAQGSSSVDEVEDVGSSSSHNNSNCHESSP